MTVGKTPEQTSPRAEENRSSLGHGSIPQGQRRTGALWAMEASPRARLEVAVWSAGKKRTQREQRRRNLFKMGLTTVLCPNNSEYHHHGQY